MIGQLMGVNRSIGGGVGRAEMQASGLLPPDEVDPDDRANVERFCGARADAASSILFAWSAVSRTASALIDAEVLHAIRTHLAGWHGTPAPPGTEWCDRAVASLAPRHQPMAWHGILIAREAYRVSRPRLRLATRNDRRLELALACYAAMAAALRISEWHAISPAGPVG